MWGWDDGYVQNYSLDIDDSRAHYFPLKKPIDHRLCHKIVPPYPRLKPLRPIVVLLPEPHSHLHYHLFVWLVTPMTNKSKCSRIVFRDALATKVIEPHCHRDSHIPPYIHTHVIRAPSWQYQSHGIFLDTPNIVNVPNVAQTTTATHALIRLWKWSFHRHFTRKLPKRMPGAAVVIHCCFSSKHSFLPSVVTKQTYNDLGCWFDECIECTEYFINMLAIPYLWDPRSHGHLWAYLRGIYVCVIYVFCVDGFLYKRSVSRLMPVFIINSHPQDSSPPYDSHIDTKTLVFVQHV